MRILIIILLLSTLLTRVNQKKVNKQIGPISVSELVMVDAKDGNRHVLVHTSLNDLNDYYLRDNNRSIHQQTDKNLTQAAQKPPQENIQTQEKHPLTINFKTGMNIKDKTVHG